MERLRYDKIAEGVIGVDLQNGYTVIALRKWSKDDKNKRCYIVSLFLKENTVDVLDLTVDNLEFPANSKNSNDINAEITQKISEMYFNGELDYYISRYKYMIECFNYGSDYLSIIGSKGE